MTVLSWVGVARKSRLRTPYPLIFADGRIRLRPNWAARENVERLTLSSFRGRGVCACRLKLKLSLW
jgi:hypothetical protein